MPPKKRNGFYFFMLDYKQRRQKEGHNYGKMDDVARDAGPHWAALAPEEKKVYEMKAKKDRLGKYATTGHNLDIVAKAAREKNELEQQKICEIEQTVRILKRESLEPEPSSLRYQTFFFIHVNYYCIEQPTGVHTPCELAVVSFTLQKGIEQEFCSIIDPGKIPVGFMSDAKLQSEECHGLTPMLPNGGEEDYALLFTQLKSFVKDYYFGTNISGLEYPPLYTHDKCVPAVTSVVSQLAENEENPFRILSLSKLLYELRNKAASRPEDKYLALSVAERVIDRDVYMYTKGLSCNVHKDLERPEMCSLSFVRRWCYIIADNCCEHIGVQLIPKSHCPEKVDLSRKKVTRPNVVEPTPAPQHIQQNRNNVQEPPLRRPNTLGQSMMLDSAASGSGISVGRGTSLNIALNVGRGRGGFATNPEALYMGVGRGAVPKTSSSATVNPGLNRLAANFTNRSRNDN